MNRGTTVRTFGVVHCEHRGGMTAARSVDDRAVEKNRSIMVGAFGVVEREQPGGMSAARSGEHQYYA